MKKVFVLAVSLLIAVGLAFTLTGCKAISPVSLEDFTEKAGAAGYTVETKDNTALAYNEHEYVINFTVYETAAEAKDDYNVRKDRLPSSGSSTEVNLAYSYVKLTSGGKYYVIYRVEATFLYVEADSAHKAEINSFLKSIGY